MKKIALLMSSLLIANISFAVCKDDMESIAPNERYILIADNVVQDKQTNLMWTQCSEGQTWDNGNCLSKPNKKISYHSAIGKAKKINLGGFDDWRVPTVTELYSLVDTACYNPSLNKVAFPKTELGQYWSITKAAFNKNKKGNTNKIWRIDFGTGTTVPMLQTVTATVRYVRTVSAEVE